MKNMKKILVILILFMVAPVLVSAEEINEVNTEDISVVEEGLTVPKFTIATGNGTNKLVITNYTEGVNYEVYRSTKKTTGYVSIGTTNTNEFIDDTAIIGYTYYYKMQAISADENERADSSIAYKKVVLNAPKAKVVSTNKTTLTISWNEVDGADGYQVYRATSKNGKYTKVATTKDTSFVNTKLTTGKGYYYKVRAYKTSPKVGYSSYSSVVGAVPKVSTTTVTGVSSDYNKVKLTWNKVSGASGYTVYRLVGKKYKAIKNTTALTYTDSKLTTGTKYTYVVRAYAKISNKKYYGNNSNTIKVAPIPKSPNVTINNKLSRYSLTINTAKVAGATGYYFYKLNNDSYELIAKTKKLSAVDKNVTLGSTQTYKVVAYTTVKGKEYLGKETIASEVVRPAQAKVVSKRVDYNNYELTVSMPEFEDNDQVRVTAYANVNNGEYTKVDEQVYTAENVKNKDNYILTSNNMVLGNTYSFKFVFNVNGVDSAPTNVVTIKPYLDKPATPTIMNYNYGEVVMKNTAAISGADGYEYYASTKKNGKYVKIGESGTEGVITYKAGYNKGIYYAVRAYKVVNGTRIYSAYSPIKGYTMNLKVLNNLPVKVTLTNDTKSYVIFKNVSSSVVKVSDTQVAYKLKLNVSKSYMRKKYKITGKVYFYNNMLEQIGYTTYSVTLTAGTKKNWSKTINVTVPKDAVYIAF